MKIITIAVDELYGNYVFSEFPQQETFYTYIEELKKEMKEEDEEGCLDDLDSLYFVRRVKTLGQNKNIVFVEEGWDKISDLIKDQALWDYAGLI